MQLGPGTKLGPYEILAPLGAGGMGEVYRARDTRLGREVAIKVLPQHLSSSPEVRARFEREARTISSINHPHICTLYDVGREADTDFLVLELIDGETLAVRLARGPLPTVDVLRFGAQIAEALDRAHRAGVVHRDLKPGNVMLTKSGVKLMDFGLARATGLAPGETAGDAGGSTILESPTIGRPLTAEGTIIGTFQYMAPEQLEGRDADARSDVWALGCVLYEMATGRHAFEGTSQASLIAAIMDRPVRPLAETAPASPPALDRLVQACLTKDPDERLQTAHDVKLQLEWLQSDAAGGKRPAGAARRHRRLVVGVLALAAVGLVAGAFLAGKRAAPRSAPITHEFHQKTFRTQAIFNARFMPDGRTTVLSAALEGNDTGLFVIRPEYPEPQPLAPHVHLLAVSSRGELAVLNNARYTGYHRLFNGTLARMPLGEAAPREVLEDVREADWSPDGESLAVIHEQGGKDRLEFPIGTVLYESAGYLSDPRVSPNGDRIAFMEHPSKFDDRGSVNVVDLQGHARVLSAGYKALEGMAWSPDGSTMYFSGARGAGYSVQAVDLRGRVWQALQSAGDMTIQDIAHDGTMAVTREDRLNEIFFHPASPGPETNLTWLDGPWGPVLTPDGRTILFTDQSQGAGPNYAVALRPTTGGAIVRLGEGMPQGFSSDGQSVLACVPSTPPEVVSYPVGPGQAIRLDKGGFENISRAVWMPDGESVLLSANEPGRPPRCFLLEATTGQAKPVGAEGISQGLPSPNGREFVAQTQVGWSIYPIDGTTEGRPVAWIGAQDLVIRWNLDGSALYTFHRTHIPTPVDRVDLATGQRETITNLGGENRAGLVAVGVVSMADDLRTMAYCTVRYTSVLYLVESAR